MESKLRKKFILICMSTISIVLFLVLAVMNITNYHQILVRSEETITLLAENDGEFPTTLTRNFERLNVESPYSTRFFTLKINNDSEIIFSDTSKIQSITQETASHLGYRIISLKNSTGFVHTFRFKVIEQPYGFLLIFIDCYEEIEFLKSFLNASILMYLNILLAIFILILIFSKRAIAPIIESNYQQQQFITDISHELKTPLSIIKVNTEVIEMENGQTQWSDSIHNQITRLNELIQYLISLTKLEEENTQVKNKFLVSSILEDVVPSFKLLASNKNMNIVCSSEDMKPYLGDEQSLKLILSILMENAIKYGSENTDIKIHIKGNRNKCILTAENKAENLKIGDYSQWFQRFYREDTSRNSQSSGFGIGLAMAYSIVEKNHGKISAKSHDGQSVIFKIEI